MVTIILGKSGSGKTTFLNKLTEDGSCDRIVPYTTRPKRDGEIDRVDYHYISINKFKKMMDSHKFAEFSYYDVINGERWWYGTVLEDYMGRSNKVVILTPNGLKSIKQLNIINHYSVYLDVNDRELHRRLEKRGDDPDEIERRLEADAIDFDGVEKIVDAVISMN